MDEEKKRGSVLGDAIKKYRDAQEWSVRKVFDDVNDMLEDKGTKISRQYLYQIEKGGYDSPNPEILKALYRILLPDSPSERREFAEALGIDVGDVAQKPKLSVKNIDDWIRLVAGPSAAEAYGNKPIDLWVISNLPIEYADSSLHNEIFKQTIGNDNIRIVYWLPKECLVRFWDLLNMYKRKHNEESDDGYPSRNLACILCPPELTLFSFAIGDPLCVSNAPGSSNEERVEPQGFVAQSMFHSTPIEGPLYMSLGEGIVPETSVPLPIRHTTYILSKMRPVYEVVFDNPGTEFSGYRLVFGSRIEQKPPK